MLSPVEVQRIAAKVLAAAAVAADATGTKDAQKHGDALIAAMTSANAQSKIFAHPGVDETAQLGILRERLFSAVEEFGKMSDLLTKDGDGFSGGTRSVRLAELEAEADYLEEFIGRVEAESV